MRVALISYEFAGDARAGGIGTYIRNAAHMLADAGHCVHVFASGGNEGLTRISGSLSISTIPGTREEFPNAVVSPFRVAQDAVAFDVVEGPEFGCDAKCIAREYPAVPLVVRLHGPRFSIDASNAHHVGLQARWRFRLGAWRRLAWPTNPWRYDPASDPERLHVLQADEIVANSRATADYCVKTWDLPRSHLSVVPYPFCAPEPLKGLDPVGESRTVLFIGKLEVRKGVLELAKAIPSVLQRHPDVTFRLVGRDLPHPGDRRPISEHVRALAGRGVGQLEFAGAVPYEDITKEFERASICVFPSDWEASGFVCLEGMAAARAVVGSSSGGMAEIIEHGKTGLLVPHRAPKAIAAALNQLLASPETCRRMGQAARASVSERYAPSAILPLQIAAYERAIANASKRSGRPQQE